MSNLDPQSDEARLARHRATHRVVHPDIAKAAREVADLRLAGAEKALKGAIDLLTLMYESPSLAGTRALVLIEKELPVLQEALDDANWTAKGLVEWRAEAVEARKQRDAAFAMRRLAFKHLDKILNGCTTAAEQQAADADGRDYLNACGF